MSTRVVQVFEARFAPEAFGKDVIALVTFGWEAQSMDPPVRITRWNKASEKAYASVDIMEPKAVKVYDANLRQGKRGPWLSTNNVEVPRDVQDMVVIEVCKKLNIAADGVGTATAPTPAANGQAAGSQGSLLTGGRPA